MYISIRGHHNNDASKEESVSSMPLTRDGCPWRRGFEEHLDRLNYSWQHVQADQNEMQGHHTTIARGSHAMCKNKPPNIEQSATCKRYSPNKNALFELSSMLFLRAVHPRSNLYSIRLNCQPRRAQQSERLTHFDCKHEIKTITS